MNFGNRTSELPHVFIIIYLYLGKEMRNIKFKIILIALILSWALITIFAFKNNHNKPLQIVSSPKCQEILTNKQLSDFTGISYSEYPPNENSWDCDCEYYTSKGYGFRPVQILETYDAKKKIWNGTKSLYDSVQTVKDLGEDAYYIILGHLTDKDEIDLHIYFKKQTFMMSMPAYRSNAEAKEFMEKTMKRFIYDIRY